MLNGIGASQGYGIGKTVVINEVTADYSSRSYTSGENEIARLHKACEDFIAQTKLLAENLRKETGIKEAEILEGHIIMLNDPFMMSQMEECIGNGVVAEKAVESVCDMFIEMFSTVDDELTRQRVSDIKDIKNSILEKLSGSKGVDISEVPEGSVLVAKDLTPSMTSRINRNNVSAIITEIGGVTSHSAIIARAMGIPAVLSLVDATSVIESGELVVVNGFNGNVIVNPTKSQLDEYRNKQSEYIKGKEDLRKYLNKDTITSKGERKYVYGNIGRPEDVQNVIQNSGEGIGLFRTEFLFMDRSSEPTEEEQYEAYSTVARAMDGREVIIRTLDVGGDKEIPYLNIEKEENPFLGHRGIRYCLDNPELFKRQIRAILRAAIYGDIKIMLPLVTTTEEVLSAEKLIRECESELESEQLAYCSVKLGVMIETPAAVLISDKLAQMVDFFSIGTNDLTAYVMAADRGNSKLRGLYNTKQKSVLRAIDMTIKNAKKAGIMVGMCGEAAADESLIPKLVEWGLDEFSVTPSAILQTRKIICEGRK